MFCPVSVVIQPKKEADKQRDEAERTDWRLCWLKELAEELKGEGVDGISPEVADRLLIARLQMEKSTASMQVFSFRITPLADGIHG